MTPPRRILRLLLIGVLALCSVAYAAPGDVTGQSASIELKGVTAADLERAGVRIVVESGSCRVALGDGITSYSLYGDANKPADCVPIVAVHVYDRQEDHFGNEYWDERAPQCSSSLMLTPNWYAHNTTPADSSVVTNP